MSEQKQLRDFSKFQEAAKQRRKPYIPLGTEGVEYWRNGRWLHEGTWDRGGRTFTEQQIHDIIESGDLVGCRSLSRYYYRTNSIYRNNIDFLSQLFLYDTAVIPIFEGHGGSRSLIIKAFHKACEFIDNLDLKNLLGHITREWLIGGIYNGILRESNGKVTIQDLPDEFCRTRFKDYNNLNVLEFNLNYFEHIKDADFREAVIRTFPKEVQDAWIEWAENRLKNPWVKIPGSAGGVSFCFTSDPTPLLIGSIPELRKQDDATKREEQRDENELYKLLIQRMPIDSHGELVFQLEEVADIHSSVADMLADTETVDVLTTFGEASLEDLQDTSASAAAADKIEKYRKNTWDALGRGEILFNPTNSSSLAYSIKKDETVMKAYINAYETWIKYILNYYFNRPGIRFDFSILPTTIFNRQDLQTNYLRAAQYGYSKMLAGVSMGIKQADQLSLMEFENEYLKMSEKMIPLQSSYTTSGTAVAEEEKNSSSGAQKTENSGQVKDLTDTGGRPELPDEQKSEKTQANINAG